MSDDQNDAGASLARFEKTYFEECAELLDAAYGNLAELAEEKACDETMHAIFRAVHSIKGGAGAFGFNRLVAFAHELETLLDTLREGSLAVTPDVVALLLRAADALADLIDEARSAKELVPDFEAGLMQALRDMIRGDGVPGGKPGLKIRAGAAVRDTSEGAVQLYRINFMPKLELFQRANEPLLVIRGLRRLGAVRIETEFSRLPNLAAMEVEDCYLGWRLVLSTAASQAAVEEVFDFVVDDCDLSIELVGVATPVAAVSIDVVSTDPTPAASVALAPESARGETALPPQSIRVDVDKVDRVVNLVGELVINQAMLRELGINLPPDFCPGLINGLETLSQNLRELQESVMAIRAQPVKSVFSRMPRLVRELAVRLGKEVRLVVSGESTEIDKTVIEQLADPLTHLLRNAVDHGIESSDEREALGKPRLGTIHLRAGHRSGRIVIEISDDGRVVVGCDVEHDRAAVLERVDVMEGEEGIGFVRTRRRATVFVKDMKARASAGHPAIVLDERLTPERQIERPHDERVLGDNDVVVRRRERVHVRRLVDLKRRHHVAPQRPVVDANDLVGGLARDLDQNVEGRATRAVVLRVRGRDLSRDGVIEVQNAARVEGRGIELDRQRRLGQREVVLAVGDDIDVGVVRGGGAEDRGDALQWRTVRVGIEFRTRDAVRPFGLEKGRGAQKAVGVGDAAVGQREPVHHREPIEPVPVAVFADLEPGRPVAQERTAQPRRQRAADGQRVDGDLAVEAGEAEAVIGGGGSG